MVFGPRGRGFGKVGEVGGHFGVWEGKAKGVMRAPYGWVKPGESCLGDSLAIKYGGAERWAVLNHVNIKFGVFEAHSLK